MRPLKYFDSIIRNRTGAVPRPAWCTYLVTFRCNATCSMCDSWKMPKGEEMTVADVATAFGKLGKLDVVRLSGGEPFLRADFPEIAETIRRVSQPSVLHITTNGSLPARTLDFARGYAEPKKLRFMISFDGLAEEHDANRGRAVTFSRALGTVRCLAALRKELGFHLAVNHTVFSMRSMRDGDALRRLFDNIGVEVQSVLAYSDSSMYGADRQGGASEDLTARTGYPLHPNLDADEAVAFVEREIARCAKLDDRILRWGKQYYLRGLYERLTERLDPRPSPRCVALRSHIRLLPDGSVPVCQFNTATIGNVLRQDFAPMWHGIAATKQRRWVDRCPGCWAECEAIPSAVYTGDILLAR